VIVVGASVGFAQSSQALPTDDPTPSTGASPTLHFNFSPSTISVSADYADGADGGSTELDSSSDGWVLDTTCPWTADDTQCTFSNHPAGEYRVMATQTWSDESYLPGETTAYVIIPPAPTISVAAGDGIYFTGTGVPGDTVRVSSGSGEGSETLCDGASVDSEGSWYCYPESSISGSTVYHAVQIDTAPCDDESLFCEYHQSGGVSAIADSAPLVPTVHYQLLPGEIDVTATPAGAASSVTVDWSSWQQPSDDDSGFTFVTACNGATDDSESPFGQPGPQSCHFTGLTPGVWRAYSYQDDGDGGTSYFAVDDYYVIPTTPVITSANAASDGTITVQGTAPAGTGIHIKVDGDDVSCAPALVTTSGAWTCVTAPIAAGLHSIQAFAEDLGTGENDAILADDASIVYRTGGLSTLSTPANVTVVSSTATATVRRSTTTPTSTIPVWTFTVNGVDLNNVHPGDTFTITGTGLPPGAVVSGELHSTVVKLGSATVQSDGSFTLPVVVPANFETGPHELVMTLTLPGGVQAPAIEPITVVPAGVPASSGTGEKPQTAEKPSSTEEKTSHDPGHEVPGGGNILTHGLNNIAEVVTHPAKIPAAIAIGLVLLIFGGLPAHLLNSTIAEQYDQWRERMPRGRRAAPRWWQRLRALMSRAPFLAGIGLTTITAIVFGFADPHFGFTLASLRLFLGLAIALAVTTYLVNVVVGRLMRGYWKVDVEVRIRPLGLVVALVGVVISRALEFSPGFLVGLVIGLVITEKALQVHAWRAVLLRTSILLGLALVTWFSFSLFDSSEEGGSFATELAIETLVAITTEAVAGLLIELLPLRLLQGEKLYEKTKLGWGALYLLTVVIFVVAVVPWEGNWAALGSSLWTWLGVVVGFGVVATAIYLFVRIRSHEEHEDHDDDELVPIGAEPDDPR
jgi:hypothetical protein